MMMARGHQDGHVEDASSFTIIDLLGLVRQGRYDMIQVIDTAECMKEMLTILDPPALGD